MSFFLSCCSTFVNRLQAHITNLVKCSIATLFAANILTINICHISLYSVHTHTKSCDSGRQRVNEQQEYRQQIYVIEKSFAKRDKKNLLTKILSCFLCLKQFYVLSPRTLSPSLVHRFCISFPLHFIHFCLEPKLQCLQFEISGDTIECKHIILKEFFFRRLSPLDLIRFNFNLFFFRCF